ncbi:MAG: B12-binding domain-containing protein, partial [archaeon]|nr:B12-binding domain-containing protein [archaeon]
MADELVEKVKECIVKYKVKEIIPSINAALAAGIPAITILQEGMVAGMTEVGEGFKNNTVFMPQMLVAAKAMQAGLVVLKPKLAEGGSDGPGGKAVVCSVLGDVHDIGKNLVTVMLQGQGLEVNDLGADVSVDRIMEALDADETIRIAALSSSMTPTREPLRETVAAINGRSNRDQIAVMVGGATMDQQFCDEIGADMYT